ncbi:cell division protein FtsZ [Methanobrevibacter curvatus]|uniref:Cell division protein FtsZ n=1 Tax=Methanobrevibacter curvatus TaxID=49547 RepID=A0A166CNZ8_9EURY|nr:cell division protein FtsZ [Methanobrevibacter curvatus]KZX14700.1 cell division protein FtsZ [Methanobrevibacter curvatus]
MKFIDEAIKESEKRLEKNKVPKATSEIDEDLIETITIAHPKIFAIGTGGAGNNTITRLNEKGVENLETITINSDAQDLLYSQADKKILIGRETCKGLGAGGKPEIGELCAEESIELIKDELSDANMVFITCGLGGGTGSGSAPVIAKTAKKLGALTIVVVSTPFISEGPQRVKNAVESLKKLKESADSVIVVPNEKLLEVAPNLPIITAYMVSDEILGKSVKGITDLIMKHGATNLDFSDVKSTMSDSGMSMIGMGESESGDRALESVYEALNSPLLDLDISEAQKAIVDIVGSNELTTEEVNKITSTISDYLAPGADIIMGIRVDNELQHTIRTTVIISGVKSQDLLSPAREVPEKQEESIQEPWENFDAVDDFLDDKF